MLGMPGALGAAAAAGGSGAGKPGFNLSGGGSSAAQQPVAQKTIMGMTSPFVDGTFARPGSKPEPARAPETRADTAQRRAAPVESAGKRTMLGVAPAGGFSEPGRPQNDLKKTMLGVPPPADSRAAVRREPQSPAGAGAAAAPAAKVAPQTDRTMLGIPTATPSAAGAEDTQEPSAEAVADERDSDAGRSTLEPAVHGDSLADTSGGAAATRGSGVLRALLAALAGALAVLAAGLAAWHFLRAPEIGLRVMAGDEGEQLEVQVPDAKPGTKVRFLGAERELKGGAARFPLAADALSLGDNELAIGIVRGSDVASTNVRLHVGYRARVDLAPLSQDPPGLAVVIEALPGSKVSVDGQAIALDAKGRASKRYPISAQTGTKLAFSARYRIEPKEGAATEGELSLNLPVTSLQIDRPGPAVTTDQAEIEVAGAVEGGAHVTVDDHDAKVNEGRFLHRVRLPKPGDYVIQVLARAAGKVPRVVELKLKRVDDLSLAAATFHADPSLTYARIAQNPVIYRGQSVAFDGRVYNVEVKGGVSHLQMLVQDCPGTQRCPLWVELPQATEATVDSWVRVLGTIAGEQQFRSERGQVHTVPSVQAQYVLKLAR